ncbi:MAG: glycosyltransferase family 2 protein [Planctomycetota bacterium]|jgi:glycosyltransferase involved in cell wall biosynthesis|nr:glycosyl transferase [Planctomycetota bacterium]MDP6520652.1 glycosyltransferase family 2 protein [Planctomycetota bacterium]MDP6839080.1 glycosyltransferase family 2 protein [Planctomycetota bacterium]MDP6955810.1 glycosyltransferase family 2 protein [Planctomycetota bacterium]
MKLSVLIPVYNEEATLEAIVKKVLAAPFELEVLLIDDCSKDSSREIMTRLAAEHSEITNIHLSTNLGKGGAIATGMEHFSGDVVLIQDADLEYDPADYPALLRPIQEGKADVVYGSRFLGGAYSRAHLFWHYVANRSLTLLSNIFTGLNLTDMETCYKVFTADIARRLNIQSRTFALEPEMTAKVARMGARVFEVPISYAGRDYSEGKKIGAKDGLIAIWAILRWSLFG